MSSEGTLQEGGLLAALGRREEHLPLDGVRVVDLTQVWAGPLAGRQLADLGAEVIRVEHRDSRGPAVIPEGSGLRLGIFPGGVWAPDPWNRQGAFNKLNRNKLSLCLDVSRPGGLEVLKDLIAVSDVVMENFSARVLPGWGLDWQALQELNPRLIYLSMPGFGRTGPNRDFVANGAIIEPHAGLASLMSYDGRVPFRTQATFSDPLVGVVAAWAVVAGLLRREQTGEGLCIDLAHTEATTRVIGAEVLAAQGEAWEPVWGNRDAVYAPQGVYPCKGEDEWIAITVQDSAAWKGLCAVLGRSDWAADEELAGAAGRARQHDRLDAGISGWTRTKEKTAAMEALQAAGVAAAAVLTNRDMVEGDVLAPDFLVPIRESWGEEVRYPRFPVRIANAERRNWYGAPRLGEHNYLVLRELLGRTDDEINELLASGTIADCPSEADGEGHG